MQKSHDLQMTCQSKTHQKLALEGILQYSLSVVFSAEEMG